MATTKISVLMAHYKRSEILDHTLSIYEYSHDQSELDQVEFVIIDDSNGEDTRFPDIINKHRDKLRIKAAMINEGTKNPVIPLNYAIKWAEGEYVLLTCCEIRPVIPNILTRLYFHCELDRYVTCGAYSISEQDTAMLIQNPKIEFDIPLFNKGVSTTPDIGWLQHSKFRNERVTFFAAINRERLIEIGGYDEDFKDGWSWDDNELRDRIERNGFQIVTLDYILTLHLWHYTTYKNDHPIEDKNRNEEIYRAKKAERALRANEGREWGIVQNVTIL